MAKLPRRPSGFGEGQTPFGPNPQLAAVHTAYDLCCAFTGASIAGEARADPLGSVLRLDTTGPIAPDTVVPACLDAIYAYERGHLAIGPRFEFLVALDRINPEFLERLNPAGRLTVPADPAFHLSASLLKAHRHAFAEGFIE